MKAICLSIIFIAFVCLALINLQHYRQKVQLLQDLLNFFEIYINEISFNKSDYMTIVENNSCKFCLDCKIILYHYLEVSKYPTTLRTHERNDLFLMFSDLGKHDLDTEISVCKNAKIKLLAMTENAVVDCKSKGELRAKLIFVLGLILLIIML